MWPTQNTDIEVCYAFPVINLYIYIYVYIYIPVIPIAQSYWKKLIPFYFYFRFRFRFLSQILVHIVVCGLMVIVDENEYCDSSSKPELSYLPFT